MQSIEELLTLLKEADICLLYDSINQQGNKALEDGYISSEELRALTENHEVYHKLGGNGYLDALMKKVKELPV